MTTDASDRWEILTDAQPVCLDRVYRPRPRGMDPAVYRLCLAEQGLASPHPPRIPRETEMPNPYLVALLVVLVAAMIAALLGMPGG